MLNNICMKRRFCSITLNLCVCDAITEFAYRIEFFRDKRINNVLLIKKMFYINKNKTFFLLINGYLLLYYIYNIRHPSTTSLLLLLIKNFQELYVNFQKCKQTKCIQNFKKCIHYEMY